MNLYEHEGKELLRRHGIEVPKSILIRRGENASTALEAFFRDGAKAVAKAQALSGKRAGMGGIVPCAGPQEAARLAAGWFERGLGGFPVESVLVEERVAFVRERYAACLYDARSGGPVLLFGRRGGTGVEEAGEIVRIPLDLRDRALANVPESCRALVRAFFAEDARQIEINPLAERADGSMIALDAKVALDPAASFRHPEWNAYPPRTELPRPPTVRETAARKLDEGEAGHRGTAGTYLELDGDVATLFSGGGASLANMDALARLGLRAANYTEYSGNPPREKVRALADIVLSKPGLRGLWIAGGVANFTDIKETLAGVSGALEAATPTYPIVVRRAGPNEEEGLALMRECAARNRLRMKVFGKETPMADTAAALAEMMARV